MQLILVIEAMVLALSFAILKGMLLVQG